jgi:acetyl-CoA/propionyl-CoA carboxylase biotin carboxyl carrier protein
MYRRVLIANRGEIALRIIRTLREMELASIAIFSDADRDARYVAEADEAYYLGPSAPGESYLNVEAILSVAGLARAEAVHPGYGFLAENAPFAEAVESNGMTFIGPSPRAIRLMGDKVEARKIAQELAVPVVPGTPGPVDSLADALACAERIGYPIAVKASGGGGGRGIRVVESADDMAGALERARREAEAYFKNPEVYLERYFPAPHHVEIQVLGDRHGCLVHLGERDCSVQRRHQKLIEETPSPVVDRDLRTKMGDAALRVARSVDYSTAGTVEFLVTPDREFFFLEMNTRIQVEHPITERVTGVDLVREMVLAAAGEPITVRENVLDPNGHAIEVRVNAEDPLEGFRPTPTAITRYREPGGIGIRLDSGVYQGFVIPQEYDSLMAKLISWAPTREAARRRCLRALGEYVIEGPASTLPFATAVLRHPAFAEGKVATTFVEERLAELEACMRENRVGIQVGRAAEEVQRSDERRFEVEVNRKLFQVRVAEIRSGRKERRKAARSTRGAAGVGADVIVSPMHGTVISIKKVAGDDVTEGETVFVVEAMKMENEVSAHRSGRLRSITVGTGETVEAGQVMAAIE